MEEQGSAAAGTVTEPAAEEATARRNRFGVYARTAALAGVCVTAMYLVRGAYIAAGETIIMIFGIEGVRRWVVRSGDPSRELIGTHLWIGIGVAAMIGNAVTVGQDQAVTVWYMCVVPMLVAHLTTVRAATQWLAVCVAGLAVVGVDAAVAPCATRDGANGS